MLAKNKATLSTQKPPSEPPPVKEPDLLTVDDFACAVKRKFGRKLTEDELLAIKDSTLDGQPVWEQNLSDRQLQEWDYASWREYVACSLIKSWRSSLTEAT